MVYKARTQRAILGLLIVLQLLLLLVTNFRIISYFSIGFIIFLIIALFIQFQVKISDDSIYYEIFIFRFSLYKKEVSYDQIRAMKFKRIGWAKKSVVIHTERGLHLRIHHFTPDSIYNELLDFAELHHIPTEKTKDYLILEKLN